MAKKMKMPSDFVSQTRVEQSVCYASTATGSFDSDVIVPYVRFESSEHARLRKLGEWCIQASKWLAAESKKPKAKETT
jgi:hypothetical protein